MVILHCGFLLEISYGKIGCQNIYFHSERHIGRWNNHQFCWCLHCEYLSCGKVLSYHFCYEKKWQDICILKASEFIRLWFLTYLWSFPKAYCLCVPVQLKCSYPVSQGVYGRRHFYFLTGPMLLYIVGPSLTPQQRSASHRTPSWELHFSWPSERQKGVLKSTLQEFKASLVYLPTDLSP